MSLEDFPSITEWFNNQSIFITGASGFLGKVLLHKLLKSCLGIHTIYVLLRPKRGKTSKERLDELFSSSIFDEFKLNNPELLSKVKMIEGDVAKPYLGIKESDWKMLQECVTLIFNGAASVRFDDSLQKAIFTNTRSAKHAILLAKGMKNLKAFVHVSTAYTNCNFAHIKEEVVPINIDPEKLITAAETMGEYKLEVLARKILDDFPNTYIFTKNIAEVLVHKEKDNLPVIIYRPALVNGSTKEPEPGWCDSFNGLTALMLAMGKGVLRVFICTTDHCFDCITVDACVNGMIAGAWYRDVYLPIRTPLEKNIVFNATDVKQSLAHIKNFFEKYLYTYPLKDQLWAAYYWKTTSVFYYKILNILMHVIPGLIVDGALEAMDKKPMLMKIYRKLYAACLNLQPFTTNNWVFDTDNFDRLKEVVPPNEKRKFFIDSLFESTREEVMYYTMLGARKLVGDPVEVSKEDIDHVIRLYWMDLILRLFIFGVILWSIPFSKTWEWSVNTIAEYQEAWNSLEADY